MGRREIWAIPKTGETWTSHHSVEGRGYTVKTLKNKGVKDIGEVERAAIAREIAEEQAVIDTEPKKPHLYLTDTTTEALRRYLELHGSIGMLSVEGSSLVESFGRYSGAKGPDMALLLSAHAGDADKGARVSGTHGVQEALASLGITVQPVVLQTLGRDRMAKGRGFLDRILWFVPSDPRGTRNYYQTCPLDKRISRRWREICRRILDIPQPQKSQPIPSVILDTDATEEWLEFAQGIEDRQKPGSDLVSMSGFASKLAGAVARIALAYHLGDGYSVNDHINKQTMLQAIGLGLVLIDHTRAARGLMVEDELSVTAQQVLDCLRRKQVVVVRPWEVAQNHWGGCRGVKEAREVLMKLAEHNFCRPVERQRRGDTGANPKDAYEVNPGVLPLI